MSTPSQKAFLSEREIEVLRLLADGQRNKEIAQRLGISVKTVEHHKGRLYAKIGGTGSVNAVRFAISEGYLADVRPHRPSS